MLGSGADVRQAQVGEGIVTAFLKNSGLGFTIPYMHNGEAHDFNPDFIVRLATAPIMHLILETKGYDPLDEVKKAAAQRWVKAVNAEGSFGRWGFRMARNPNDVGQILATSSLEAWLGRLTSFYNSWNIAPRRPHRPANLFDQIRCTTAMCPPFQKAGQ